ncbi:MAG: hypothetical protein NKF70_00030 [Methanobacterium sp. ERen5]|nr:MAG: hypothetical protein NKF70_00030 [Methanobacterium sp. ERen5]
MASIIQYKGFRVLTGVSWEYDKTTLTVTMYPGIQRPKRLAYKPYKKVWKNVCPNCGKLGVLRAIGAKGRKTAVEGEINCTNCDSDFDGVQSYEKINGSSKHLEAGSSSSKSSTSSTLASLKTKQATALGKVKSKYNDSKLPKKDMTLKIPPLPHIMDGYCHQLDKPLVSRSTIVFVESVEITQKQITMKVNDKLQPPGDKYSPPTETTKTTSTTSTSAVNYTASSDIEKKIMAVGNGLKKSTDSATIQALYNYLQIHGSGGFSYKYYWDWPGGNVNQLNTSVLSKRWNMKSGNCVFFAWAFYVLCKGAGVSGVKIIHNSAGHFYNKYNGKIYDCTHAGSRWFAGSENTVATL